MPVKKYDQFVNEKEDDDFNFLDKIVGKHKKDPKDDPRLKFELPDSFVGGKNVLRPKNPQFKNELEPGDRIIYRKAGADHDGKKGIFRKIREDGKFSIQFDDGTKFACNGNNVQSYTDQLGKKDITLFISEEGGIIEASAMKGTEQCKGITKLFPELIKIGFEEESKDNLLVYHGDLNKEELINELQERDFIVDTSQQNWP